MRIAALDIGSNTVKITVYDQNGKNFREIGRKSITAGLLSHIREGNLTPQGCEILIRALSSLSTYAGECGCETVCPFATASLRAAANAPAVIAYVRERLGLSIDLLGGDREAELTFRSFCSGNPNAGSGILLDMGGGSTEVIEFAQERMIRRLSMPFGALSLHNRFVKNILPTKEEAERMAQFVRSALDEADFPAGSGPLWLNGGSGKRLALLDSDAPIRPALPYRLDRGRMEEFRRKILDCDPAIKALILRKTPDAAHTVPAALIALSVITDRVGVDSLTVTDAGVREGYLLDRLDRIAKSEGKA